jgi:hypothetical protein
METKKYRRAKYYFTLINGFYLSAIAYAQRFTVVPILNNLSN